MKMPNRESTPSSGNVFADLNLPQADDLLAKAGLAAKIIAEIQRRRLTQSQAAAILGIDQLLGRDIEITGKARAKPASRARLRVA
jgi:predicted XRE-type DNA-binding protein